MDWLNVRKQRSAWVEDVFSAGIWLASAPLHEAGRTRKSASTLKAKQGIGQLDFVSDNSDALFNAYLQILSSSRLFNAYLQILSSSRPHSEVASTTHIPALKGFRKRRFSVFWFTQDGRPSTNAAFQNAARRELSRQKIILPQPAETHKAREISPLNDKIP